MDAMKTALSNGQLQEADGVFHAALEAVDMRSQGADRTVPRQSFRVFENALLQAGYALRPGGEQRIGPSFSGVLGRFPGLRGLVHFKSGNVVRTVPGVILEDEVSVGALLGQKDCTISTLTHILLDNIYHTQRPDVVAHKGTGPQVLGGHALVAASYAGGSSGAHDTVHAFARTNFGAEFDASGARDIRVGHDTLRVRSAVLPLAVVALTVAEAYQPESADLLGVGLIGGQMNLATVVAATMSREHVNSSAMEGMVRANLEEMRV
jgi:hypothetical protein